MARRGDIKMRTLFKFALAASFLFLNLGYANDLGIKRQSAPMGESNLKNFEFNIIKKGKQNDNTLLIVGGIQGDEPGGFMAASLIATHYDIVEGSVWVVPNLNFYSILKEAEVPLGT